VWFGAKVGFFINSSLYTVYAGFQILQVILVLDKKSGNKNAGY
jgi:hypothetical protein